VVVGFDVSLLVEVGLVLGLLLVTFANTGGVLGGSTVFGGRLGNRAGLPLPVLVGELPVPAGMLTSEGIDVGRLAGFSPALSAGADGESTGGAPLAGGGGSPFVGGCWSLLVGGAGIDVPPVPEVGC